MRELDENQLLDTNGGIIGVIIGIIGGVVTVYTAYEAVKSEYYDYNYNKAGQAEMERLTTPPVTAPIVNYPSSGGAGRMYLMAY